MVVSAHTALAKHTVAAADPSASNCTVVVVATMVQTVVAMKTSYVFGAAVQTMVEAVVAPTSAATLYLPVILSLHII